MSIVVEFHLSMSIQYRERQLVLRWWLLEVAVRVCPEDTVPGNVQGP